MCCSDDVLLELNVGYVVELVLSWINRLYNSEGRDSSVAQDVRQGCTDSSQTQRNGIYQAETRRGEGVCCVQYPQSMATTDDRSIVRVQAVAAYVRYVCMNTQQ